MPNKDDLVTLEDLKAVIDKQQEVIDELKDSTSQFYEGKNLADTFADEIADYENEAEWFSARVKSGNFDGIHIRDYFDISLSNGQTLKYMVGAIDPYMGCGYVNIKVITEHHAIMVPDDTFIGEVQWNANNSNNGTSTQQCPYLASDLHKFELDNILPTFPEKWRNVMTDFYSLLEKRYSTSGNISSSNGWSFENCGKIFSPSVIEVSGSTQFATPGYANGIDCQWPIFRFSKDRVRGTKNWRLRNVGNNTASGAATVGMGPVTGLSNANISANTFALPCFQV